jgi:hypothetical protein
MGRDLLESFVNSRCRIMRQSDAKLLAGWVTKMEEGLVFMSLSDEADAAPGQEFWVEVHGEDRTAVFPALLVRIGTDLLELQVRDHIRFLPSREKARVRTPRIFGTMTHVGSAIGCVLEDVSLEGCGIVANDKVPKGVIVALLLHDPQGETSCLAEVRYCRPDHRNEGAYRVGLLVTEADRLNSARWRRLYRTNSAA